MGHKQGRNGVQASDTASVPAVSASDTVPQSEVASATVTGTVIKTTRPVGRPSSYKPEYCDELLNYFLEHTIDREPDKLVKGESTNQTQYQLAPKPLPTLVGFAAKIGVAMSTLQKWADDFPEFHASRARALVIGEHLLAQDAYRGLVQFPIAAWLGNNYTLGLRDKKEVHTTTDITVSTERVQRLTDDQLATIQRILSEAEPKQLAGESVASTQHSVVDNDEPSDHI